MRGRDRFASSVESGEVTPGKGVLPGVTVGIAAGLSVALRQRLSTQDVRLFTTPRAWRPGSTRVTHGKTLESH